MTIHRGVALLLALCAGMAMGRDIPIPMPRQNIEILRDLTYAAPAGSPLRLDLYMPARREGTLPVVLAIHGGTWVEGGRQMVRPLGEYLAGEGFAVVAIDYRLAPRTTFPAQLEDARAAARWIRDQADTYGFDMTRFTALGLSAGGHLAALLGVQPEEGTPRVTAVTTFAGPFDFTVRPPNLRARAALQVYLGASREDRPDLYAQASPITHVTPDDPPFFLIHGTRDDVVPYSQSARMAEALQAAGVPVTLVSLEGAGHSLDSISAAAIAETMERLVAFLVQPAPPTTVAAS